jgi:hypothetical protein
MFEQTFPIRDKRSLLAVIDEGVLTFSFFLEGKNQPLVVIPFPPFVTGKYGPIQAFFRNLDKYLLSPYKSKAQQPLDNGKLEWLPDLGATHISGYSGKKWAYTWLYDSELFSIHAALITHFHFKSASTVA